MKQRSNVSPVDTVAVEVLEDITEEEKEIIALSPSIVRDIRYSDTLNRLVRNRVGISRTSDDSYGLSSECRSRFGAVNAPSDDDFERSCGALVVSRIFEISESRYAENHIEAVRAYERIMSETSINHLADDMRDKRIGPVQLVLEINDVLVAEGIEFRISFAPDLEIDGLEFKDALRNKKPVLPGVFSDAKVLNAIHAIVNSAALCAQYFPNELVLAADCHSLSNPWLR